MRDIIVNLFGVYNPVLSVDASGVETVADGFAGVDWPWIFGVVIFCILLIYLFRMLGVLLKK